MIFPFIENGFFHIIYSDYSFPSSTLPCSTHFPLPSTSICFCLSVENKQASKDDDKAKHKLTCWNWTKETEGYKFERKHKKQRLISSHT